MRVAIFASSSFKPVLTASLQAFAMKGLGNEGAEIDLEIVAYQLGGQDKATYQMQLPIWKPSGETGKTAIRLKKDRSELADTTSNGCYEDSGNPNVKAWAYTYEKYDARQWTSYKLEWFDKYIKWHSGGLERVSFENKKASSFPRTPLVRCCQGGCCGKSTYALTRTPHGSL